MSMSHTSNLFAADATPDHERDRDDQASRLRAMVANKQPEILPEERAHRAPMIAVASGKGGVGKTTTCVNLSIALARHNRKVCLLDADLGCANADVLCGLMPNARIDDLPDGVPDPSSLRHLVIDAPGGFSLVPGSVGIGQAGELDGSRRESLTKLMDTLRPDHDALIVDTSAGLGRSVTSFLAASDYALIVMTPEPTSVADAYALIKVLVTGGSCADKLEQGRIAMVINQVSGAKEATRVYERMAGVCTRFLGVDIPMLGYVRSDKRVPKAVKSRSPLLIQTPRGGAAKDMLRVSKSLIEWAKVSPRVSAMGRSVLVPARST